MTGRCRQALQAEGALRIAQPASAKPLPPFHQWSLRAERYTQWLADQHAVHYVLESAIGDALTVATPGAAGAVSQLEGINDSTYVVRARA